MFAFSFHALRAPLDLGKKESLSLPQTQGTLQPTSVPSASADSRLISSSLLVGDCPLASADRVATSIHSAWGQTCPGNASAVAQGNAKSNPFALLETAQVALHLGFPAWTSAASSSRSVRYSVWTFSGMATQRLQCRLVRGEEKTW